MRFQRYQNHPTIGSAKPFTTAHLSFAYDNNREEFQLPALLDTGSKHIIFPGDLGTGGGSGTAVIQFQGKELILPLRGTWKLIGGLGEEPQWRPSLLAELRVPGFEKRMHEIYFHSDARYVILGITFLVQNNGICFTKRGFRPASCLLYRMFQPKSNDSEDSTGPSQ